MLIIVLILSLLILTSALAPLYGKTRKFGLVYLLTELSFTAVGLFGTAAVLFVAGHEIDSLPDGEIRTWASDTFWGSWWLLILPAVLLLVLLTVSVFLTKDRLLFIKKSLPVPATVLMLMGAALLEVLARSDVSDVLPLCVRWSGCFGALLFHLPLAAIYWKTRFSALPVSASPSPRKKKKKK